MQDNGRKTLASNRLRDNKIFENIIKKLFLNTTRDNFTHSIFVPFWRRFQMGRECGGVTSESPSLALFSFHGPYANEYFVLSANNSNLRFAADLERRSVSRKHTTLFNCVARARQFQRTKWTTTRWMNRKCMMVYDPYIIRLIFHLHQIYIIVICKLLKALVLQFPARDWYGKFI